MWAWQMRPCNRLSRLTWRFCECFMPIAPTLRIGAFQQ